MLVASERQLSASLEGEQAILNLDSGTYFGLNRVGSAIWEMLAEPRAVEDVIDAVVRRYEVSAEVAGEDVVRLLEKMVDAGLVDVVE